MALVAFSWFSGALLGLIKGTLLASALVKMGDEAFLLTPRMHRNMLSLRAGDLNRFATLVLLDLEIG